MKKILTITLLILLTSCGSDDEATPGGPACSPSKAIASLWTRVSDGQQFDMEGVEPNQAYEIIVIDDGVCQDSDAEFTFMYDPSTLTYYEGDCAGNLETTYDYTISCDNELTLTDRFTQEKILFR